MNEKSSILVIKIQPDNVEQPVTGLVVCLSGFAMGGSLPDMMYSLLSNETDNKDFLQKTGACNHCFYANIAGGDNRPSEGYTTWLVKALFIPMDAVDMATEEQLQCYINGTFMKAFYEAFCERNRSYSLKQEQLPLLKDKKQILHVTNWNDAIHYQEDIVILVRMVLESRNVTFKNWIDDNVRNLYSLFRQGKLEPITIAQFNISLHQLAVEDKITYASFLVGQRRVNLLHDDAFLAYIRGKTALTSADDRNLESILREYGNKKQDEE